MFTIRSRPPMCVHCYLRRVQPKIKKMFSTVMVIRLHAIIFYVSDQIDFVKKNKKLHAYIIYSITRARMSGKPSICSPSKIRIFFSKWRIGNITCISIAESMESLRNNYNIILTGNEYRHESILRTTGFSQNRYFLWEKRQ